MSGYRIKFNGIDRLYDAYSWRLTRRAKAVWQSGDVLQGKYLEQLEKEIARKYNRKYAVGVGSATDGLYFAIKSLGIQKNDTVLCPALSYIATSGAIRRAGANIHFVDTDKRGNMSDWGIMGLPKAVLYVNLFGNLADYDRLRNYCDAYRIPLIEDAAQSQGAYYGKTPSGKLGDISVFSFDPMKNMPSFGSGGMVLTDNKDIHEEIKLLRRHRSTGKLDHGYNSLISEDHANQLLLLLDKFDKLQKMRRKVFDRYKRNLKDVKFIETQDNTKSSHHKLVMLSDQRDRLKTYLERHGIETKIHYTNTLDDRNIRQYPNAKRICDTALSLPIYPYLEMKEVDYICERIKQFNGVR
jgi:dTDP-4-amino-4,6-dideoxygalactose transaminase